MVEKVRLVVWDLDETFWKGTLSEGGIAEYLSVHHEIVIQLAKRGIVSSICSKNDFQQVENVLKEKNIWDYFIFPSIDWSSKPDRIQNIIEQVQLRPETVLFIDDNPSNIAAVKDAIPNIQVASEKIILTLLDNPLLKGKDDSDLSRLKQYKLLERRHVEMSKTSNNNEFLRKSNIEVEIETDIVSHMGRIVELINRTNQLNFTKNRLPDDEAEAIRALGEQLEIDGPHASQVGLVRVRDRYGDYGYCGFFLVRWNRLYHFCFSCRILGFGVESWLYDRLGRPYLEIKGEVLADPRGILNVDWINNVKLRTKDDVVEADQSNKRVERITIRGDCEAQILLPYFKFVYDFASLQGTFDVNGLFLPGDSLVNTYYTSIKRPPNSNRLLSNIGFSEQYASRLFDDNRSGFSILFGVRDFNNRRFYTHKTEDFCLGLNLRDYYWDLCDQNADVVREHVKKVCPDEAAQNMIVDFLGKIREEFRAVEFGSEEFSNISRRCMKGISEEIPEHSHLFLIKKHRKCRQSYRGLIVETEQVAAYRTLVDYAATISTRIVPIDIEDCVYSDDEITDNMHYERIVYVRLFELISARQKELTNP